MRPDRFKFGVCHAKRLGGRIYTGNVLNPAVRYSGYPTTERIEREITPELVAMSNRGRMDVVFPLGIYIYAFWGKLAFPRNRLYVQQVPDKSLDLLKKERKVVYFIDEEHMLCTVDRNGSIMS